MSISSRVDSSLTPSKRSTFSSKLQDVSSQSQPISNPRSVLLDSHNNTNTKMFLRRYRIVLYILFILMIIITIRSILAMDSFPFKDLLVNEEYISPNSHPLRSHRGNTNGLFKLRHSNLTLFGMGKDIEDNIPSVFDQMVELGNQFQSYQILFVEGGSTDKTIEKFNKWRANHPHIIVKFISTPPPPEEEGGSGPFQNFKMPREGRIAVARNLGLKALYEMAPTDYVVMIDMDILGWDNEGILDSFGFERLDLQSLPSYRSGFDVNSSSKIPSVKQFINRNNMSIAVPMIASISHNVTTSSIDNSPMDTRSGTHRTGSTSTTGWDVMCANGIILHGVFRDTYAFRAPGIDTNHHRAGTDYEHYQLSLEELPLRRKKLMEAKEWVREAMNSGGSGVSSLLWSSGMYSPKKPILVDSCFGGLAIYRYSVLQGCKYHHRHAESPYMLDCEHVIFHECIVNKNQAKLFSNPNMKLWYGHSVLRLPRDKLMKRLKDWLFPG